MTEEEGIEEDLVESINFYANAVKPEEKERKQLEAYFDRYVKRFQ